MFKKNSAHSLLANICSDLLRETAQGIVQEGGRENEHTRTRTQTLDSKTQNSIGPGNS